jgi:hypothetical protein
MRIACTIAVTLLVAASVGAAQLDSDSPFGIVCPWGGVRDAGVGWVRGGAGATALGNWCDTEKTKGVYTWDGSDSELKGDIEQGLTPLPILGYTPAWASSGPNKETSAPPTNLLDYARFVGDIASRYKGRVPCWEVWNEPDIGFFSGTIGQYADLLKTAYIAAKTADPRCQIVFGGTAGVNIPFVKGVYDFGGRDFFDIMAVHPYQWGDTFNDDWFVSQLSDLRALMNSHGDSRKQIWLTELGWSSGDKGITEEVQARLLTQSMVTALTLQRMGVAKTFWFCVKDWGGPGYGLLRPDGSRKPAFTAYATLTKTLRNAVYAGRLDLGKDVRCHVFERDKSVIAVIWAPKETPVKLPASKAEVIDYMGEKIQPLVAGEQCQLQAKPQPIFIVGADPAILKRVKKPALPAFTPGEHLSGPLPTAWASVIAQEGATLPYVVVGEHSLISIRLQNQGTKPISGKLQLNVAGLPMPEPIPYSVGPNDSTVVTVTVNVPASAKVGFAKCSLNGKQLHASATVRVSDSRLIEFAANSTVESRYMVNNEGSGGAPSVRFNGTWTYKFDLSKSKKARVELNVGAHNANEWRVLASDDNKQWKTILSGKSNRTWHTAQLDEFAGKTLYLKFEGNDQQLEELILHY